MSLANEKPVTFGATIERPAPAAPGPLQTLRSTPSNDSSLTSHTADATSPTDPAAAAANPYSAFYKHPDARRSMDDAALASKSRLDVPLSPADLESGLHGAHAGGLGGAPLSAATTQNPKTSVDGRVKECTMWPSRQAVLDKRKTYRRSRGCNLFKNLTSKQRLWCKIVIALLVVAAAVGLGVGISRAVGGGVWAGQGKSQQIPNH